MPINYFLQENNLRGNTNSYMAHVFSDRKVDYDELIEKMIDLGLKINHGDIIRVLGYFQGVIETLLSEGAIVKTPFANFSTSIRDSFDDPFDTFNPKRHKLISIINPGIKLRRYYKNNIQTIKHEKPEIRPELVEYIDHESDENSSQITCKGITTVKGRNLRFNADNKEEGIYYISEDGSEMKVEIIAQNNPSYLLFSTPESLAPGMYQVEIRAKIGQN